MNIAPLLSQDPVTDQGHLLDSSHLTLFDYPNTSAPSLSVNLLIQHTVETRGHSEWEYVGEAHGKLSYFIDLTDPTEENNELSHMGYIVVTRVVAPENQEFIYASRLILQESFINNGTTNTPHRWLSSGDAPKEAFQMLHEREELFQKATRELSLCNPSCLKRTSTTEEDGSGVESMVLPISEDSRLEIRGTISPYSPSGEREVIMSIIEWNGNEIIRQQEVDDACDLFLNGSYDAVVNQFLQSATNEPVVWIRATMEVLDEECPCWRAHGTDKEGAPIQVFIPIEQPADEEHPLPIVYAEVDENSCYYANNLHLMELAKALSQKIAKYRATLQGSIAGYLVDLIAAEEPIIAQIEGEKGALPSYVLTFGAQSFMLSTSRNATTYSLRLLSDDTDIFVAFIDKILFCKEAELVYKETHRWWESTDTDEEE